MNYYNLMNSLKMSKKYISSFILICTLSIITLTNNAYSTDKNAKLEIAKTKTTKEEAQLQSKKPMDFIQNLKIGDKINGWTVSKIKKSDKERPEYSVTFTGTLKTKAKYYNYFDVPWSYGMEFGTQILLYLDDDAKNKLPFKNMGKFADITDKIFSPALADGSYGFMDVEINEITLASCECDFYDYGGFVISRVVDLKEAGRAVFGEVENFKIYDEQYKIVEDFLGDSLPIK